MNKATTQLNYKHIKSIKGIREHVKKCEGKHVQQVVYSTYHDALTQICFGCLTIRTNIKL